MRDFIPMKIIQSLLVSKDGSKFWWNQTWWHFLTRAKHFDRECIHSDNNSFHPLTFYMKIVCFVWPKGQNLSAWLRTQISSESVNFIENSCLRLSSGYGCATLFWLAKNKPEILTQYDRCGTIMDFIVSLFTNRHGFALVLKH